MRIWEEGQKGVMLQCCNCSVVLFLLFSVFQRFCLFLPRRGRQWRIEAWRAAVRGVAEWDRSSRLNHHRIELSDLWKEVFSNYTHEVLAPLEQMQNYQNAAWGKKFIFLISVASKDRKRYHSSVTYRCRAWGWTAWFEFHLPSMLSDLGKIT